MNKEIAERIQIIKEGKIPEGYKKSSIGIIPIEWITKELYHYIESVNNGISINAGDRPAKEGEIGILKTSSVTINGFNPTENKVVINDRNISTLKVSPQKDNLIIVRKNTPELVGMVNYIDKDYDNIFLPDLLWQTVFKEECNINKKYLYYFLNTEYYNKLIKVLATGSSKSMPNIRKENFLNVLICIPSNNEQDKITNILANFDKAIKLKGELIQEKQKQKKGLMERLLSGKVRVSGFDKEWAKIRLNKIIRESKERSTENNQYDILSVTKDGVFLQSEYFNRQIASEDNIGYKIVRKDQLVFSAMNLWMGSIDIVDNYEVGIVSPACKVFKLKEDKADINFMKYFVKSPYMMNLYKLNSEQGASVVRRNLDLTGLLSTKIKLPGIKEQVIIGKILRTADKEIDLLKKELEALKQQKKGLTQLLLTGIVRV